MKVQPRLARRGILAVAVLMSAGVVFEASRGGEFHAYGVAAAFSWAVLAILLVGDRTRKTR